MLSETTLSTEVPPPPAVFSTSSSCLSACCLGVCTTAIVTTPCLVFLRGVPSWYLSLLSVLTTCCSLAMWQTTDPSYYHTDLIPIHPMGKDCGLLSSHLPAGTSTLPGLPPSQSHRMLNALPAGTMDGGLFMVPYTLPSTLPYMVQPALPQPVR